MLIKNIQIENYKGISKLTLNPKKINILVGKNNTSKTSVLEAIDLLFHNERIRRNMSSYFNIYSEERTIKINAQINEKKMDLKIREAKESEIMNKFSHDVIESFLQQLSELSKTKYSKNIAKGLENIVVINIDEELKKYLTKNSLFLTNGKEEDIIYHLSYGMSDEIKLLIENVTNYMLEKLLPELFPDKQKDEFSKYLKIASRNVVYSFSDILGWQKRKINKKEDVFFIRSLVGNEIGSHFIRRSPEDSVRMNKIEKIAKEEKLIGNLDRLDFDNAVFSTPHGLGGHPFSFLGDGFKAMIRLLWELSSDKINKSILLLDEPETHMHPGYIKELIKFIINFSKKLDIQVFITTHSPDILDILLSTDDLEEEEQKYLKDELRIFRMNKIEESISMVGAFDYEQAKETKKDLLLDLRGV